MPSTETVEIIHLTFFTHIVLIFNQKNKKAGTGVLIQIGDEYYVLTALPAIENADFRDICIDCGIQLSKESIRIESIARNETYGFACVKLNPFDAKFRTGVGKIPFIIDRKVTIGDVPAFQDFGMVGFPRHVRSIGSEMASIKSQYLLGMHPLPIDEWPENAHREGKRETTHWLFKHAVWQDIKNEKRGGCIPTGPDDFSGSPIWVYDADNVGDDKIWYGLVGIQTGYNRTDDCLVGIKIGPIIDEIS